MHNVGEQLLQYINEVNIELFENLTQVRQLTAENATFCDLLKVAQALYELHVHVGACSHFKLKVLCNSNFFVMYCKVAVNTVTSCGKSEWLCILASSISPGLK